jgi:RNA processing factor Prp31
MYYLFDEIAKFLKNETYAKLIKMIHNHDNNVNIINSYLRQIQEFDVNNNIYDRQTISFA